MTNFATGALHRLCYVQETVIGTTPSTPSMTKLRHTDSPFKVGRTSIKSNERNDHGQVAFLRLGNKNVSCDIPFELSYGEFDQFLSAALRGNWDTNILKVGTTDTSFTFEEKISGGDSDIFGVFPGCMINTMSLSVQPDAVITGSFGVIGMDGDYDNATALDASPTESQTNDPFDSFTGAIAEGSTELAIITGIDMSITNNRAAKFAVLNGTGASHISKGDFELTGSITAFVPDTTLLNKYLAETSTSISFTLGSGSAASYTFDLPSIKYTDGSLDTSSKDSAVVSLPFQALYDASEATTLKITRIP